MNHQLRGVGAPTPGIPLTPAQAEAAGLNKYLRYTTATLDDRLWGRVRKGAPDECWPWTGGKSKGGYGRINWQGKHWYVHQLAYVDTLGPVPEGKILDHTCHNGTNCTVQPCPHRACCNPAHLEAVTHKVNSERGNLTGRVWAG